MTKRNLEFKQENGKVYMSVREPLDRVDAGNCPFCGQPVYVAQGQLTKYYKDQPTHKKCRK